MRDLAILIIHILVSVARLMRPGGARAVVAESLLVKHQLVILNRGPERAPNLRPMDHIIAGLCTLVIRPGRLIHIAVDTKRLNPSWRCRRIAQQLCLVCGLEIDKDAIRRVLAKHYRFNPGAYGPSWLTVLGHTKNSLWSIDLFRCESLILKNHWVLVVMDQFTRRMIGFGVQAGNVDGPSLCRMFNHAICGAGSPKTISSDNDPLFRFHRWKANLRILEATEVKTVPHVPILHPLVKRLSGTIRRECLDLVPFWNVRDLESKLLTFKDFYNDQRCHSALVGDTPSEKTGKIRSEVADLNSYRWQSHCRGLYHLPVAA